MNNETKIERCTFDGCKKKIHLINFTCDYCNKKFCLKHRLPEIHLCKCQKIIDIDKVSKELRCVNEKLNKI